MMRNPGDDGHPKVGGRGGIWLNKPNILFIMSDQLRADALGCAGNPHVQTPNLDRLAAEGIHFANAFTPCPLCVPARISVTTGCYPHKAAGSKQNNGRISPGFPLLGEELNRRGYETYAVGKLHYHPYQPPGTPRTTHGLTHVELAESGRIVHKYDPLNTTRGLEDYLDYLETVGWGGYSRGNGLGNNDIFPAASVIPTEHYVDSWVADRAIHHLQTHVREKADKPFFMWASFPKPHSAYDPPHPFDCMYDPRTLPAPIGDISLIRERGIGTLHQDYIRYGWHTLSPAAKQVIKAHYYGLVSLQDQLVGRLLAFLDDNGLRDNTIVVFTSDHGDMLGDFGLFFKKMFYNGSVRIPLLFRYPGVTPTGVKSQAMVGLQDLLPTLLSLGGQPLERPIDGLDLSPVFAGKRAEVRTFFVSQCNNGAPDRRYMVTDRRWRYIYHEYGGIEELYDEQEDPQELRNLASERTQETKSITEDMRNWLLRWCIDNKDENMLEGGKLARSDAPIAMEPTRRKEPFGRRYY